MQSEGLSSYSTYIPMRIKFPPSVMRSPGESFYHNRVRKLGQHPFHHAGELESEPG
jgi:hypothetical protein